MKNHLTIKEEDLQDEDLELHQELADLINEYISNKTGYCHKGFTFQIEVSNIIWDKS
jgi:hypothetical protein